MKYKKLTKEQLLISFDRLTRFKNTKDKYLRVFADILSLSLIEPKIKKDSIYQMDYSEIVQMATEIINNSQQNILPNDLRVNHALADYENSCFKNDEETQKILNNTINYNAIAELITDDMPQNLRFLKTLTQNIEINIKFLRAKYNLKYPVEKVLLVEGATEETLLPAFSKYLDYDFDKNGIAVIAAGGKNQVTKKYYELIEILKLPIFVLLDKDAEENIKQITPKLRQIDKIHLVSCGEFEDLLPKSLIIKTVNAHFENFLNITEADLSELAPMAKILEEIFKTRGLHEFKKAEFAKLVSNNITQTSDISDEIKEIVQEIKCRNIPTE